MKTEVFKGRRRLDMKFDTNLRKSTAITISLEKIKWDLSENDIFKGTPTIFGKFVQEHKWGFSCQLLINNKSRTYEDMDYEVNVSNDEIFEHIIEEIKNGIRRAGMRGYGSGYTI